MSDVFKNLVFALLLTLSSSTLHAATIHAKLDRTRINLNDTVQLTLSADSTPDEDPDLEPLSLNFEILNQSHSSQISWINGQNNSRIEWVLQLLPKQAGTIVIPAISFGNDKSEPLTLEVSASNNTPQMDKDADMFLKVEASPKDPYVQSQVLYTMRLYRRVEIVQPRLEEPKPNDAVMEKLGEDINYTTQINGIDYDVTERRYAIFPQKSGTLTIQPMKLTADVISQRQSRFNGFFSTPITQAQRITSEMLTLQVKPIPQEAQSKPWLPAEDLQLRQEWSGDINKMQIGDPLTRTITVLARGSSIGLLPELHAGQNDPDLKQYPDKAATKELQGPDGVTSQRQEKIAYIASKPGTYLIPAIEIAWFNTKTNKMEVAKIEEQRLTVVGTSSANQTTNTAPASAVHQSPAPLSPSLSVDTIAPQAPQTFNIWMVVSLALATGWIATLIYFLRKKPSSGQNQVVLEKKNVVSEFASSLKQSCSKNDAQGCKQILLAWGKQRYGVNNLGMLAEHCDSRLRDEILHLNTVLYAPDKDVSQWQGKKLYQAFIEQGAAQKLQTTPEEILEPLFKL